MKTQTEITNLGTQIISEVGRARSPLRAADWNESERIHEVGSRSLSRRSEAEAEETRPTFGLRHSFGFRISSFVIALALSTILHQPSTSLAQSTAFTYQGRLEDGANLASGIYDLRFRMYDAASAGTQQGSTITNTATAVSNGLFTVALDFGNQFPGADRWLEVGVRTNSGGAFNILVPRQLLTSTPYAVRAANFSGTVAAGQISGNISSNNIGASSITSTMLAAGAVTTTALADGAVTAAKMATVSNWFALTIANPTPAANDYFGVSVAAFGGDRIIVGALLDDTGATDAGAAYLFRTNGTLLTTFTNPTPAALDYFGVSVAAVGSDRVLVGAYLDDVGAVNAGAAYLFSTNGALLTTFTNPTPAANDLFGRSVAALGGDRVIIGAYEDNTGATDAGAAYLFSTNGTLLTTYTNPAPANDFFGFSVAALGSDRVIIGAYFDNAGAGAAYLFSTNGTLLTAFTNPNPTPTGGDIFGGSVAAVGNDRVLIGAYGHDTNEVDSGAAYLFSTNGALLTIFNNPTPAVNDKFGYSVTAVGSDQILVGAEGDDTGATPAGAAYLFSTNGTLLNTFTNPTPVSYDFFGNSVAAMGSNRVVIGAYQKDTGAGYVGAAYLFTLNTERYTPGLVADAVRAGSVTTASLENGAVTDAKITSVDASKITSGVLDANRIPNLDASKITTGVFNTNRIPNVDASKITGTISSNNIGAGSITGVMLANGAVGSNQLASGAVTTTALAQGAVTGAKMATVTNWFALTFANPTPKGGDEFGISVGALGNDRVIIGAGWDDAGTSDGGAAYLFNTNGTLLTTFTNPTPAFSDLFGYSVAAVGSDRVIIGAHGDDFGGSGIGSAYLFSTNGALLITFTNPTPANGDQFGHPVAAVGGDRVIISANGDNTGATNAGAAYLFNTNGTLISTFTNPSPADYDNFANSLAVLGSDRVLIATPLDDTGATNAGVVYLFSTNGTLITTLTNPIPDVDDYFGASVAVLGSDLVLIGAIGDDTGVTNAGAAYLFSTNGTLISTFANPSPANGDQFGRKMAAVGNDRLLIGAYGDDTGATNAGAAYLFSTNGTLLATFTNPTPETSDGFGISVVAVGVDQVLIGAASDNTGKANAGAAYLFSLETFSDGLTADAVRARSITTASLEDGAVTLAKLDPSIITWLRSGNNVFCLDGSVGVGTTTPSAKLHLYGNESRVKLESSGTSFFSATEYVTTGRKWDTGVGGSTSGTLANKYYIYDSTAGAARMVIDTSGNVGINTTAPTAKLSVNGTANNTTGVWGIFSDRRLKENITPMAEGSLDRLLQLKGVTYDYNKPELREGYAESHRGWIAQDVEKVFPEWISETEDGMKMLTPVGFNAITVEALRELRAEKDAEIKSLKTTLEAENAELKARLEKLEQLLTHKHNGATK